MYGYMFIKIEKKRTKKKKKKKGKYNVLFKSAY